MTAAQRLDVASRPAELSLRRQAYEEELSLFDLWEIFVRRRRWLAAVWVLTMAVAAVYLIWAPPIYESRGVFRIGRIAGTPIATPAGLALELKEQYAIGERDRFRPFISSVEVEGEDAVELRAEAYSADEARQLLQKVTAALLDRQQRDYLPARQSQESALAAIGAQIASLNDQLSQLSSVAADPSTDASVKALVLLQQNGLQSVLPDLQTRRLEIEQDLSSLASFPTHLVREPTLENERSAPQPLLILALAAVLGGMLGVLVVFILEFLQKATNRLRLNP